LLVIHLSYDLFYTHIFINFYNHFLDVESDFHLIVDSLIFVPSFVAHDSGFAEFFVVAVNKGRCLGRLHLYDTFSIYMNSDFNRVGFDCLLNSGCIRVFLPPNEYIIRSLLHDCVHFNKNNNC